MRHAYLILAHHDFGLLQQLITLLDRSEHDVYVHIDRKVRTCPALHAEHAGLEVFQEVKVFWGDYSCVEAEYALMRRALAHGGYGYYHLLSGADLPIKPMDAIQRFFALHAGTDFIDIYPCPATELDRHFRRYHLFPETFSNQAVSWHSGRLIPGAIRAFFLRLQIWSCYRRNRHVAFRKGSQWWSLTAPAVQALLDAEPWVRRVFHHTFCPDEVFAQTVYCRHFGKNAVSADGWGRGNCRYIDWSSGNVRSLNLSDEAALAHSEAFFARKFSSASPDIIEKVLQWQIQ